MYLRLAALAPSYAATYPGWNSCTVQIENALLMGLSCQPMVPEKIYILMHGGYETNHFQ